MNPAVLTAGKFIPAGFTARPTELAKLSSVSAAQFRIFASSAKRNKNIAARPNFRCGGRNSGGKAIRSQHFSYLPIKRFSTTHYPLLLQ
jgi:hypothetical protein